MTREQRIAHIGELAVEWALAQTAWEDAPRLDQSNLRALYLASDMALSRLRAACIALETCEAIAPVATEVVDG